MMTCGYHIVLLIIGLVSLKVEGLTVVQNCTVRSKSNLTLELNHESTSVRQVFLFKNKEKIASSRDAKDGWDEINEIYKTRFLLSVIANGYLTIDLQNITTEDDGIFRTTVILQNGESYDERWDIKSKDIHFEISVTKKEDGIYSCTCGNFTEAQIPRLSFKWNISDHTSHALDCPIKHSVKCSVTGPMEGCPHLNQTWTAEHIGVTANWASMPVPVVAVIVINIIVNRRLCP